MNEQGRLLTVNHVPAAPGYKVIKNIDVQEMQALLNDPRRWPSWPCRDVIAWRIEHRRSQAGDGFDAVTPITVIGDDSGAILCPDGSVDDEGTKFETMRHFLTARLVGHG
ncbi:MULTISPECIES: hypothetical protein [Rhodomicrobium]|uniref:hypothetical protein n=1 Tax=Rhodomicrobium TaxID=1068 RepID=UPI000F738BA9|nr:MULTISPECIES: hypothetical protein [Rhodomicrobium]